MSRRPAASIVASPVLIGAVTLLVTIVAVFLAYNANTGLPFVPTYDVKAELPSGAKLVKGNEVRVGGFRVGLVEDIKPTVVDGKSVALVSLKLDKTVEPLAEDTTIRVRPRSALGLRYVQVTPGTSEKTLAAGDTIPLANTSESLDLEDIYAVFQGKTRDDVLRRRVRGTRRGVERRDRSAQSVLHPPHAGDAEPVRPAHGPRPVLPRARPRFGRGGARGAGTGRGVHSHGGHVRGVRSRA
jgi:hypothetical protein